MPIGKSRRIVVDVEDVALKRDLYSALASEGRSLKEWFASAAQEYLTCRSGGRLAHAPLEIAETEPGYRVVRKKARRG